MYKQQAYSAYQQAQAQEYDQAQLILMMYRGGINFLNKALEAGKTDKVQMGHYVSKAKKVLLELMLSLNTEEGGQMGEVLLNMYQRLFKKLNTAHMIDDRRHIAEVRDSLEELEDVWRQIFTSDEYRKFKEDRDKFRLKYSGR
ncbi:MAG: flagellar export chaperone FliS [Candidatus Latescibacteria bacterium]|nr:flagellar export chaperone FliS [Candidatus Latescibacterota bacterium]